MGDLYKPSNLKQNKNVHAIVNAVRFGDGAEPVYMKDRNMYDSYRGQKIT